MQVVERSAIVSYSAGQMFELVNDVASYPQFLPWCSGATVHEVSATERMATVKVEKGILRTEFTTMNTLAQGSSILMRLVKGPFRELSGQWRFEAIADRGSRVSFRVEFEFKNRLTAAAFGAAFESMCGTLVEAFATQAQKIYG